MLNQEVNLFCDLAVHSIRAKAQIARPAETCHKNVEKYKIEKAKSISMMYSPKAL